MGTKQSSSAKAGPIGSTVRKARIVNIFLMGQTPFYGHLEQTMRDEADGILKRWTRNRQLCVSPSGHMGA
jgi:hypothetical protein